MEKIARKKVKVRELKAAETNLKQQLTTKVSELETNENLKEN